MKNNIFKIKEYSVNRYSMFFYFCLIIFAVFTIEFGLMFIVEGIKNISHFAEVLIDSTLLSVVLSPIIYLFSFRILAKEISKNIKISKKYEYLFQNSPDANMTLNPPDWKFTDGNPAMLKLFGLKDREELNKVTPGDLSPKYQPDGKLSSKKAKEMIDVAMAKGSNFFEWTHKRLNGEEFLATVLLTKIKVGDEEFLQALVRDITEQKTSEYRLKKIATEMKRALADSERANKLMVGRELEMIKLKKEINELKKSSK